MSVRVRAHILLAIKSMYFCVSILPIFLHGAMKWFVLFMLLVVKPCFLNWLERTNLAERVVTEPLNERCKRIEQ